MNFEADFLQAAQVHGLATHEGDSRRANRAYRALHQALQHLRQQPDRGVEALLELLKSDAPSVVCWAALYLLPDREAEAIAALSSIAEQGLPLTSLGAATTLQEWKAGRLRVE